MSRRHRLQELLRHPRLWRGRQGLSCDVLPTGFAELDRALSGGWPAGALIEFLPDTCGVGEFSILLPALLATGRGQGAGERGETSTARWITLVAPPYIPYAPALARHGIDVSRMLIVHGAAATDSLWAAEQALHSGTCSLVLTWSDASDTRSLRRLQLAAESAGACAVIFRPGRYRRQKSPAAVRIRIRPADEAAITLDIFKNRGGRPRSLTLGGGPATLAAIRDDR